VISGEVQLMQQISPTLNVGITKQVHHGSKITCGIVTAGGNGQNFSPTFYVVVTAYCHDIKALLVRSKQGYRMGTNTKPFT